MRDNNRLRPPSRRGLTLRHVAMAAGFAALAAGARPCAAQGADDVYASDQLTTLPKLASMPKTAKLVRQSYPANLRSAGITGTVEVKLVVGPDGKVEPGSVQVVAASVAALGEAARGIAEKIEFTPGKVKDEPVRARVLLPIVYRAQ